MDVEHSRREIGGVTQAAQAASLMELMRNLLNAMPNNDSDVLAAVGNSVVATFFAAAWLNCRRTAAVDPGHGSITAQAG